MNLIKETIIAPLSFSVTGEAEEKRNSLILASRLCECVTNGDEQDAAVDRARDIRTYVKDVEAMRVSLTKPLLEAQRAIKALSDAHLEPAIEEQKRVEALVTRFQEQEQLRVAKEEQARQIAFQEAERKRIAADKVAIEASTSFSDESGLSKAIAAENVAQAAEMQVQAIIAAPMPSRERASGAITKKVMRWEVVDMDALYKARPELCKVEAKAAAIQSTCVPEVPVPGLKLWWENQTSIRSR